jgi:hypothetical protein
VKVIASVIEKRRWILHKYRSGFFVFRRKYFNRHRHL